MLFTGESHYARGGVEDYTAMFTAADDGAAILRASELRESVRAEADADPYALRSDWCDLIAIDCETVSWRRVPWRDGNPCQRYGISPERCDELGGDY